MSLWKVADGQTQAPMVDYYQHLLKGEGRSAALREAQKAMIAALGSAEVTAGACARARVLV